MHFKIALKERLKEKLTSADGQWHRYSGFHCTGGVVDIDVL